MLFGIWFPGGSILGLLLLCHLVVGEVCGPVTPTSSAEFLIQLYGTTVRPNTWRLEVRFYHSRHKRLTVVCLIPVRCYHAAEVWDRTWYIACFASLYLISGRLIDGLIFCQNILNIRVEADYPISVIMKRHGSYVWAWRWVLQIRGLFLPSPFTNKLPCL